MAPSPKNSQSPTDANLLEAQRSGLETASKLSALAMTYVIELNKTWFDFTRQHLNHYADLSRRLVECRTPQEVFSLQAGMMEKVAKDYKEGLSAQAGMVEKATTDYKAGLDQLATMSDKVAAETSRAIRQGLDTAETVTRQAGQTMEKGQQAVETWAKSAAASSPEDTQRHAS